MSATNKTLNYELPIFIDTDKPSWLGDWNGAMTKIDNSIKTIDGVAESGVTVANEALTTAEGAVTTANNALTASGEAKTEATAAKTLANNAYTLAGDAQVNSNIAIADSTKNKQNIQAIDDKLSVTQVFLTKTAGVLYDSYAFISRFITKFGFQFSTTSLKTMEHDFVQVSAGNYWKIPFCTYAGNPFGLPVCPSGDSTNMIILNNLPVWISSEMDYLRTMMYFDGVNTNFGIWIEEEKAQNITKISCFGDAIYLPSGRLVPPLTKNFILTCDAGVCRA